MAHCRERIELKKNWDFLEDNRKFMVSIIEEAGFCNHYAVEDNPNSVFFKHKDILIRLFIHDNFFNFDVNFAMQNYKSLDLSVPGNDPVEWLKEMIRKVIVYE